MEHRQRHRVGRPVPEVKVGLVGYRDRGDAYVTKITDLNADLTRSQGPVRVPGAGRRRRAGERQSGAGGRREQDLVGSEGR